MELPQITTRQQWHGLPWVTSDDVGKPSFTLVLFAYGCVATGCQQVATREPDSSGSLPRCATHDCRMTDIGSVWWDAGMNEFVRYPGW